MDDLQELHSHVKDLLILAHRIEAKTEKLIAMEEAGQEQDARGDGKIS